MATNKKNDSPYTMYKGLPLVKSGNAIYYGNPEDKYIIYIEINQVKIIGDLEIPTDVIMQLISTDPELKTKQRIIKHTQKDSIYHALDVGAVWLERALAQNL
jgi:hypothetical protein